MHGRAEALVGCGSSPAATENTAPAVKESQEQATLAEESKGAGNYGKGNRIRGKGAGGADTVGDKP